MSMHAWLTSYDCLIAMIAKHFHGVHTIVTPPITSRLSVCRCTELAQAAVASCTEELHSIRTAVWVPCELQFHECTRSMSSCFGESVRRSVLAVYFFCRNKSANGTFNYNFCYNETERNEGNRRHSTASQYQ